MYHHERFMEQKLHTTQRINYTLGLPGLEHYLSLRKLFEAKLSKKELQCFTMEDRTFLFSEVP